jgi:hypothetical protein
MTIKINFNNNNINLNTDLVFKTNKKKFKIIYRQYKNNNLMKVKF